MEAWGLLQHIDCLLKEVEQSQKLAKMLEGEHDTVVQKLSLSNDQLATKRMRADTTKAFLAIMSACLNKSATE